MLHKAAIALAMILSGPAMAAVEDSVLQAPVLQYPRGAYFYGSDCGGNTVPGQAAKGSRAGKRAGVILGGGASAASGMNCDDRRTALTAYRDGFEGKIGQAYGWRNPNGGGQGSITPLKAYVQDGFACRQFRETSNTGPRDRNVAACRQGDGNWHIE